MLRKIATSLAFASIGIFVIGCGGSGGSTSSTTTSANISGGGHVLSTMQLPSGDLSVDDTKSLPIGTVVGVALDRNNMSAAFYTAKVKGYDALNNVAWLTMTDEVTTAIGEGDSGTQVFTLPNSLKAGDPRNSKILGSLSFGSPDNQREFFATPISVERGTSVSPAIKMLTSAVFNGISKQLRPLTSPLVYSGIPSYAFKKTIGRTSQNSLLRTMQPAPTTSATPSAVKSRGGSNLSAYQNNTIMTWISRGDMVFAGATGSVTATDNSGWVAYGHPLQATGPVSLATNLGMVQGMVNEPVWGTYKLASPIGTPTMSMVYDGLNGVRISDKPAPEVGITTQLLDGSGKVIRSMQHYVGTDGLTGDKAFFIETCAEAPIFKWYDRENSIAGSATVTVTTVINGSSKTQTIAISQRDDILFASDPTDFSSSLDEQIYQIAQMIEQSGDSAATMTVSYTINTTAGLAG